MNIGKYDFEVHQVKYLGLIIHSATEGGRAGSVSMESVKTNAIKDRKSPSNRKDIQSFIAFANFYYQCEADKVMIAI